MSWFDRRRIGSIAERREWSRSGYGVLSAPAFWAASGDPASHVQRGHTREAGKTETTLPARAAASICTGRAILDRASLGSPV